MSFLSVIRGIKSIYPWQERGMSTFLSVTRAHPNLNASWFVKMPMGGSCQGEINTRESFYVVECPRMVNVPGWQFSRIVFVRVSSISCLVSI